MDTERREIMPTIVATVKLKEDKIEEGVAFLKELASGVLASEPGTTAYVMHQRRDDPRTVVVYEKYESDEAFAIHSQNLGAKGAEFMALLDGAPEIVILDEF
jgi:quinol monooxygenase YgiN